MSRVIELGIMTRVVAVKSFAEEAPAFLRRAVQVALTDDNRESWICTGDDNRGEVSVSSTIFDEIQRT